MAHKPPPENGYPPVRPGTTVVARGNPRSVEPVRPAEPAPLAVRPEGGPPQRARHDPEDHAEQMAHCFAAVLPTLLHATARVTTDQRVFLEHLAERKGQWPALAPFIQATLTETEALFLRRVLIGMPDAESEKPTP